MPRPSPDYVVYTCRICGDAGTIRIPPRIEVTLASCWGPDDRPHRPVKLERS